MTMLQRLGDPGQRLPGEGPFVTTRHTLSLARLPRAFDGFLIAHVSDLHGAVLGDNHGPLVRQLCDLSPDMIICTGDMVSDRTRGFESFCLLAKKLDGRFPLVFSVGNHEQELRAEYRERGFVDLEKAGIEILDNRVKSLTRQGEHISLAGLHAPLDSYRYVWRKPLMLTPSHMENLLGECPAGCTLLLAHNPLFFDAYAEWGADVTFSGHVHGGIIEIPGHCGLLSPERRFFPRYSAGCYEQEGKYLLVSRGLCAGRPLPRIHNPRELIVVSLHRKADA